MWNYAQIGNELAMKMAIIDGVKEPTLTQIQTGAQESVYPNDHFKNVPAWKFYSEPFLGIPQHYYTLQNITQAVNQNGKCITSADDDDLMLPKLPYSLANRSIYRRLIIIPKINTNEDLPSMQQLTNGTIIVTGHKFPVEKKYSIEISLILHNALLPCCFAKLSDVILHSPLTANARVRCYFLAIPTSVIEITFIDSNGNVICRSDYVSMNLHGSSTYQEICEAIRNQNVSLNENKKALSN